MQHMFKWFRKIKIPYMYIQGMIKQMWQTHTLVNLSKGFTGVLCVTHAM